MIQKLALAASLLAVAILSESANAQSMRMTRQLPAPDLRPGFSSYVNRGEPVDVAQNLPSNYFKENNASRQVAVSHSGRTFKNYLIVSAFGGCFLLGLIISLSTIRRKQSAPKPIFP